MIDDRVAGPVEFRRQQLLGQRHADRIGEPLAERTGGGLHARRDADFRDGPASCCAAGGSA